MGITRGYGLLEGSLAELRARKADQLLAEADRKGRILDLGCGASAYFLNCIRFAEKFGIDRIVAPHDALEARRRNIELIQMDLTVSPELPFPDEFFQAVTALAVIEHLPKAVIGRLVGESMRVLQPGGFLVLTTPPRRTHRLLDALAVLRLVSHEEIDEHQTYFTQADLTELLETVFPKAGVRVGCFELGLNLYACARKPNPGE